MFFSQTVEYALRAAVALAAHPQRPQTTQQLSLATRAPAEYLAKVMQLLARAQIVSSQRGPHGGFRLCISPETLSILDVVNAVEPIRRIERCPLDLPAHGTRLCPLHKRLDQAIASIQKALAETTLAQLLGEPSRSRPLCDIPVALSTSAK